MFYAQMIYRKKSMLGTIRKATVRESRNTSIRSGKTEFF